MKFRIVIPWLRIVFTLDGSEVEGTPQRLTIPDAESHYTAYPSTITVTDAKPGARLRDTLERL